MIEVNADGIQWHLAAQFSYRTGTLTLWRAYRDGKLVASQTEWTDDDPPPPTKAGIEIREAA